MCKYEFLRKEEKKNGLDGMDNDCNHNSRHYYETSGAAEEESHSGEASRKHAGDWP